MLSYLLTDTKLEEISLTGIDIFSWVSILLILLLFLCAPVNNDKKSLMESAAVTTDFSSLSLGKLLPLDDGVPIIGRKANLVSLNTSSTRLNDQSFFIISLLVI